MNPARPPREWYLRPSNDRSLGDPLCSGDVISVDPIGLLKMHHVIEYGAYEALFKERDALKAELAIMDKALIKADARYFDLNEKLATARAALEFYAKRDWRSAGIYPSNENARKALADTGEENKIEREQINRTWLCLLFHKWTPFEAELKFGSTYIWHRFTRYCLRCGLKQKSEAE